MTELKIDLSSFSERFATNSKELTISKKVNFVFGKNGTGKTTITDAIKNQLSSQYNVCVFKDFENVVGENRRLDAIALGKENTEIQEKIGIVDKEIEEIKKEIDETSDKTTNLFTKNKKAGEDYKNQENKIDVFFVNSAKKIKNLTDPQIAKTTYIKNDFKNEIINAKLLSDEEIKKYKETIKAEKKNIVDTITLPNFDLGEYLKSTNGILQSSVLQQQVINELADDTDKQNFAREGMKIHEHKEGEKCAFCGNEISESRWQLLGNYFNEEVKKLEDDIKRGIKKIDNALSTLNDIKEISKTDFYEKFTNQIKTLNLQIRNGKNEHKTFFETLKSALESKAKNLFTKSDDLKNVLPANFDVIKKSCDEIVKENTEFSQNLTNEKDKAQKALRYHEVKKALDTFNFNTENASFEILKKQKDEAQNALSDKKAELEQKIAAKNGLILQTKDEKKISQQINKLLKNMGVASFSLELVNDTDENQKGQYQIKGYNGKIRPITDLSKGEKNIIVFLYFLFSLEKVDDDNKPKIVLLDDPMTSNDDTMQYLMIGEIQKFYQKFTNDSFFILLTHNCHFYLNVRPDTSRKYKIKIAGEEKEISHYEKYGNYYLLSDGTYTTIQNIQDGKQDFKTNYEMLWKELLFLYQHDKPDLMLNPCRKICETYMKFTKKGIEKFYGSNTNAKKLFDVNQHSVDDLEAEQNGRTREEIKNILEALFKQNDAEEHYRAYFPLSGR